MSELGNQREAPHVIIIQFDIAGAYKFSFGLLTWHREHDDESFIHFRSLIQWNKLRVEVFLVGRSKKLVVLAGVEVSVSSEIPRGLVDEDLPLIIHLPIKILRPTQRDKSK